MPSSAAALVKLRWRAAASNTRMAGSGGRREADPSSIKRAYPLLIENALVERPANADIRLIQTTSQRRPVDTHQQG
jgi:hypothetical protein